MTVRIVVDGEIVNARGLGAPLAQMLQCARDYPGLPDVRTLTVAEISTFYRALIPEILRASRGK